MSLSKLLDRPIAFHRPLVTITGSVTAALLLSQALYWAKRCSTHQDGKNWFYKTMAEWEEETGLSRREQESARKRLRDLKILDEKKQGIPAKTYFSINFNELDNLLAVQTRMAESANLCCAKPPTCNGENRQRNTENTAENTAENTTDIKTLTPQLRVVTKAKPTKFDLSVFTEQPSQEIWNDFIQHRKNLRATLTQTALNRLAKQINLANEQGYSTDEVLEIIQLQGWKGFEVGWLDNLNRKSKSTATKDWDTSVNVAQVLEDYEFGRIL